MARRGLSPSTKRLASEPAEVEPLYTAPALEKGLDILELLAGEGEGLTQGAIAQRLGRSAPELFRMLSVLQRRGYLERSGDGSYQLSLRLFELSHRHPPLNRLLQVAVPAMEELAEATRQSCHLVVHYDQRVIVVAQVDSPEPMGFRVRLGTHYPMRMDRASPRVLTAFQPPAVQDSRVAELVANSEQRLTAGRVRAELARVVARGLYSAPSNTADGVTDLCAPIFDHHQHEGAVAALTVPFLAQKYVKVTVGAASEALLQAAERISTRLGSGAGRPHKAETASRRGPAAP